MLQYCHYTFLKSPGPTSSSALEALNKCFCSIQDRAHFLVSLNSSLSLDWGQTVLVLGLRDGGPEKPLYKRVTSLHKMLVVE